MTPCLEKMDAIPSVSRTKPVSLGSLVQKSPSVAETLNGPDISVGPTREVLR